MASLTAVEVPDLLAALLEKSLVGPADGPDGVERYSLAESVRQYSMDCLLLSEESDEVRGRHCDYYVSFAEASCPNMSGPDQTSWLDTLDAEQANLRHALDWCLREADSTDRGLRLTGSLQRYWVIRGDMTEGRSRLAAAISYNQTKEGTRLAEALNGAGGLASLQGDYSAARQYLERSLSIRRQTGDLKGVAYALNNIGAAAHGQGDYVAARVFYAQGLALCRETADSHGVATCLNNLGYVAEDEGDYAAAIRSHVEALAIQRRDGDRYGEATSLSHLGYVAYCQGDYDESHRYQTDSLAIRGEIGDQAGAALSLVNLGLTCTAQGDPRTALGLINDGLVIFRDTRSRHGVAVALSGLGAAAQQLAEFDLARQSLAESVAVYREVGNPQGMSNAICGLACIAASSMQTVRAVRLFAAAYAQYSDTTARMTPYDRRQFDAAIDTIRAELTPEAFETAWYEGAGMSLEQAADYALDPIDL